MGFRRSDRPMRIFQMKTFFRNTAGGGNAGRSGRTLLAAALLLSLYSFSILSCGGKAPSQNPQELVIFHAGSLSAPFKEISHAFMEENPGVKIDLEAAGSRSCARKIVDLGRSCDVMASADYTVIDELLIPGAAKWNIKFAANEMAIVYHERSRMAGRIDSSNWYEILLDDKVAFGRSDPDSDPCGYRTVLTMKLAEKYYQVEGLAESLLAKDNRYIRPKETDLLALLESGAIDYIFLYRSVAEQHGLERLLLPGEINLNEGALADLYATVSVEISGKEPGTTIVKRGAPMIYGVTIPDNSPNPKLAEKFVEFLLDPRKGMAIMERNGQPSVVPAVSDSYGEIPPPLKKFALPPG